MKSRSFLTALFLTSLVIFGAAGCSSSNNDAAPALESASLKVIQELTRIDLELKRAAGRLGSAGLTGTEARAALDALYNALPYAVDCAAVDSAGRMVTIEPASYRHFEGGDISNQEQVKRMLEKRNPVMSGAFLTVEGIEATDVEYPVLSPDGSFLGSVSLLFSAEKLLASVLAPIEGNREPAVWVMESAGRILFHPDPARLGKNFFAWDKLRLDEPLRRLAERFATEPEGKDAQRRAAWKSAGLYDTAWRLIVFDWKL